jgi:hypothetical protein
MAAPFWPVGSAKKMLISAKWHLGASVFRATAGPPALRQTCHSRGGLPLSRFGET